MQILCVYNNKGGVGKTSTSIHLAAFAARNGIKTLLIDADAQGSASRSLGFTDAKAGLLNFFQHQSLNLQKTKLSFLDILTANIDLAVYSTSINYDRCNDLIKAVQAQGYALCIFDCAPTFSSLQVHILRVSSHYLIPIEPQFLALDGLITLFKSVNRLKYVSSEPVAVPLGILFTKVQKSMLSRDIQTVIRKEFGSMVIEPPIPWSALVDKVTFQTTVLFEKFPKASVTRAYESACGEILRRLHIHQSISLL